jgi:hypothetical protein
MSQDNVSVAEWHHAGDRSVVLLDSQRCDAARAMVVMAGREVGANHNGMKMQRQGMAVWPRHLLLTTQGLVCLVVRRSLQSAESRSLL